VTTELVIVDWDGGEMLARCLRSIAAQTEPVARVILWDNASREPVSSRIGTQPFETLVLRSEMNCGFTGGINGAMSAVTADYVGWINNDVELDPQWHSTLKAALDGESALGAVQPVVMRADGRVDGAGIDISSGRFLQAGHLAKTAPPAWGVSGTATLFRTRALHDAAVEGVVLHPAFFAYYEDVELSARMLEKGWKLAVVPEPLATHAGSASGPRLGPRAVELRTRNRYWVRRLHPGIGSYASLAGEDLKWLVKELLALQGASAASRIRGMARGCFGKIDRTGRGVPSASRFV
jgi:GT2 family glycosyltransferase